MFTHSMIRLVVFSSTKVVYHSLKASSSHCPSSDLCHPLFHAHHYSPGIYLTGRFCPHEALLPVSGVLDFWAQCHLSLGNASFRWLGRHEKPGTGSLLLKSSSVYLAWFLLHYSHSTNIDCLTLKVEYSMCLLVAFRNAISFRWIWTELNRQVFN